MRGQEEELEEEGKVEVVDRENDRNLRWGLSFREIKIIFSCDLSSFHRFFPFEVGERSVCIRILMNNRLKS